MSRKLCVAILSTLVLGVPVALAGGGTSSLDQSAPGPSAGDYFVPFSQAQQFRAAQTFTAGQSGSLSSVVIPLVGFSFQPPSLTGTIVVDVTAVTLLGEPDSTAVIGTSAGEAQTQVSTSAPTDLTFTFSAPVLLVAGTKYAIVIREVSADLVTLYASQAAAPYSGGEAFLSFDNGVTFFTLSSRSLIFSTYGNWATGAPVGTSTVPDDSRWGYCSAAGNTDRLTGAAIPAGTFLNLGADQPLSDTHYRGAVAANYLEGSGISCDVPAGFRPTGEQVGYYGEGDPGRYTYYAHAG